jgi:hypothetical protein
VKKIFEIVISVIVPVMVALFIYDLVKPWLLEFFPKKGGVK